MAALFLQFSDIRKPHLPPSSLLRNLTYRTAAVTADVTSAKGVAQTTPFSPIMLLNRNIAGISTTPFLMIERVSEAFLFPTAWKTVLAI